MGFTARREAEAKRGLQLVVLLPEDASTVPAGVDAGVLRLSGLKTGAAALKKASQAAPGVPWGVWPVSVEIDRERLLKLGADFLIFAAGDAAISLPADDETGILVQIDTAMPENLLRALNELPVDAVLLTPAEAEIRPLLWRELMLIHRFASLVAKPLLVSVPPGMEAGELQLLWEAGVEGVVAEAGAGAPLDEIERLRQAIDGIQPHPPRKRPKMEPVLPLQHRRDAETAVDIGDEDEED
jgi:HAMP domain-containing protein